MTISSGRSQARRTIVALVVSALAVTGAVAVVATTTAAQAAESCTTTYTAGTKWSDRFNLSVTVSGSDDWIVTANATAPQTFQNSWSATVALSNSDRTLTARPNGSGNTFGFTILAGGNWTYPAISCQAVGTNPTTPLPTTPTTGPPATPDITVNTATKYQTIDGFGAAQSIWGSAWSTAETQTLVGMGANQFGLSIVRTGISPVDSEWSVHAASLKTAETYGSNVKVLASPWTAPAAWKSNNSRINGGTLKTDYYDDYALHLNSFVQYMKGQGVKIDVTSIQNEPDWAPAYDSMSWTGTTIKNFVAAQGAKVLDTRLMVAESLGMNPSYTDPTLNDATARNTIGYIGGHLYGTESAGRLAPYPLAAQYNKPVWMTEWNSHTAAGDTSTAWGDAGNKAVWDETLDTVMRTVNKSMESNWSAYIWWYGKRFYSFIGDGSDGTGAGAPLKRGYAFSQFAKYVRPGYQRIGLTKSSKASPLEVTAYQGDGKITLVLLNRSTSAVTNAVVQVPQNVTKAEDYLTSQTANAAGQPTSVNGGQATVSVPARSISTLVLTL